MNKLYVLFGLVLLYSPVVAQTNYVATKPNSITPGNYNTLVGAGAGNTSMTGTANSFVGYLAGTTNTTGGYNNFIGYGAGQSNSSGGNNNFIGINAGVRNSSGGNNNFIGANAGFSNGTGSSNVFVGYAAGYNNTTGGNNSLLGNKAGINNTTGGDNSFMGNVAGYYNTTGYSNVAMGTFSSYTNTTGHNNVMLGDSAGYNNTVSGNVFVGSKAGYTNTTGSNNTFFGYHAGYNVTTGSNNIIIGPTSGTAITDGTDNVLMGYNSQAEDGLHNATAIGSGSRVAISNALILGNQANVGIGTSAPTAMLHVNSTRANESGMRLEQLTSNSPATCFTDQFLTVNEKGDVIKARYQLRINNASEWSDKVFAPGYQLRPLTSVATYIGQHGHLPGIPSATQVASEGVDLVKMNAMLLEKVEELTLYSIQQEKANQGQLRVNQEQQQKLLTLEQKQAELKRLLLQVLIRKQ